jgi:hypothetical protein
MELPTAEPGVATNQRSRRHFWIAISAVLAAVAAAFAWWLYASHRAAERELAAKAELAQLGALVVMDAQRKHVNSVNLSTLKSPETLNQAIARLPALSRIKSLNVDGTQFGNEHAATVGRLTHLQDLVLSNTSITDIALQKLSSLSRLTTIHLANTAITNAGMPSLAELRSLKIVDISGTKITGNLEPLSNLTDLSWLVAGRLTLDEAAIQAIGRCPNLTTLSLAGSTYPETALAELTRKHPALRLDR